MPSLVILAATDTALADAWERQLPAGRSALRIGVQGLPSGTVPGFSAVVVLDAVAEAALPPALARCPTIYVGEPRSLPFEQAKLNGRAKIYLSYEESATQLRDVLPLLEELAEKQGVLDLLQEKSRRAESARPAPRGATAADSAELWDFFEGAIENLETREQLVAEFRRAARSLLRASHTLFFLRDTEAFRADRGPAAFAADDPLVAFFESHPALIDGTGWDFPADPVAELAVRNRLALWGARLLVPVHDNGRLLGLIALGVRDDGQPYDEADRTRAIFFARLLRHCLTKSEQFSRLHVLQERANLGVKYLPGTLVLGPDEAAPRHVPLAVRDLIGRARRDRQLCRLTPTARQPWRASAGPVVETGGTWAFWQEASDELAEISAAERASRRQLLRELGLTLNHELGNALVSLATFRFSTPDNPLPSAIFEAAKSDITKLEALNSHIAQMLALHETQPEPADLRELAQRVGGSTGVRVEVGAEPIVLNVCGKLLEFALRSLVRTIVENRGELAARELTLHVRSSGAGHELTALLSLRGKRLELEGILPEPSEGATPNQGRVTVFLAKEILRLHHGDIHAGPGLEGTEIHISVRAW
jgi:hypothetical protein